MAAAMRARTEVAEQQAAVKELLGWQKSLKSKAGADSKPKVAEEAKRAGPGDAHTYDKGYKRWEKYDVVRLGGLWSRIRCSRSSGARRRRR